MAYESNNNIEEVEALRSFVRTSVYEGRRNYDFDAHKRKWFAAREALQRHGHCKDEEIFVRDFMYSIQDPRLLNSKAHVNRDPKLGNNFNEAAAFLSKELGNVIISTNRGGRRTVSSVETSNNNNNNGGKSSGKRTRFKGNKKSESTNETGPFTGEVKAKYYPPHIFRTFTDEQRAVHKKLSEPFHARQKKRAIAAATTTNSSTDEEPTGAGDEFGGYRAKKTKRARKDEE